MTIEEYAATLAKEFGSTKANKESAIYRACIKMGIAVQDKLIEKACNWLREQLSTAEYSDILVRFRKVMEDK